MMTTAPTIIETLFVEIFDRKKRIIEKLNDQKQLYDQHLASKLIIQGITPPPWLLKSSVTTHNPSSSDLGELNKEELISGLLFPHQHSTVRHQNNSCFFCPITASSLAGQELPVDFYNGASASSKCFHENIPIILPHGIGHTFNNDFPASPQDPTYLKVPDICYESDQSLARIQRSRSRQKALELRNSAKASDKCRLGQESSLGLCFDDAACQLHVERFNEFSELDEPAASFSGTCRAVIGDFSNKESQDVGDSISTSMGDKSQPNSGAYHNDNNKSEIFSHRMGRSRSNLQKSLVVNSQINQELNDVHSLPRSTDDEVQADAGGYDSEGIKINGCSGRIVSSRRHLQESTGIGGRSNLNNVYSDSIFGGDEAQETEDHCRSNSYSGRITRSRSNRQASAGLSGKITHMLNEDYSITRSEVNKEAETGDYHRKEDKKSGCSSTLIRSASSLQQSADMIDKVNEEMTHTHSSRSVKYRASNARQEDRQQKGMGESLHSVTRDWCHREVETGYYHSIGGSNGHSGILTGSGSSVLQSADIINKINDDLIKAHNGRSVMARTSNAREAAADCQHREMDEILLSVTRDCCNKEPERGDQHSIEDVSSGYSGRLTISRSSLQQSADIINKIDEEVIEAHRTRSVQSRAFNAKQEETADHKQKEIGESHPIVINKEAETGNHHSIEDKSNGYSDRLTRSRSSLFQSADIINKINEEMIQVHCSRSVKSRTSNARREETVDHQRKEMAESLPSVTRNFFNKETEREYHHSIEDVNNVYSVRLTTSRSSLQQSADIITNKINEDVIEAHSSRYVKYSTSSANQEETSDHQLEEMDEILPSVTGDCCNKEAETGDHRSTAERSNGHSDRQTRSRSSLQQSADIIGTNDRKLSEAFISRSLRSKTSNARQEETIDHQLTEMGDSLHSVAKYCYNDAPNNRVYIGRNTPGEIEDGRSKGTGKSGRASRFSSCRSQPFTEVYDVSEVCRGRVTRSRSCEARQGNSEVTRSCNDDVCASTDSVGNCGPNEAENGNYLSMVNRIDIHGDSISKSRDYERSVKMGYCQENGGREIIYSRRMTRSRSNTEQSVDGNHHIKLLQNEANSDRAKFRRSYDAKEEETEVPHHKRRKTGYQLANSRCSNMTLKARHFPDTPNVSSGVSEDLYASLQRYFSPSSSGAGQASPRNNSTKKLHQNATGSSTLLPISTHESLYLKCEAILEHRRRGLISPADEHVLVPPSSISSFISEMAVDPQSHFSEDEKLKTDPAVVVVSTGMEDNGSFHSEDKSDDNASDKRASIQITSGKSRQEEELDSSVVSHQMQVVDVGQNIEVVPVYGDLDVNEQRAPVVTHSQPNALLEHIDARSTHAFNGSANSQRAAPEDSHAKRRKVGGLPFASKSVSPVLSGNSSQCATEDTLWSLTGVGDDSTHYQKQFTPFPRLGVIPLRPSCIVEMEELLNSKGSMTMMLKPAAEIHYPEAVVDSSHMIKDAVPPTLERDNFQLPSMPCISQKKSSESQVQSSAGEGKVGTYPTNVAIGSHMHCDDLLLCGDKFKTAAEKMGTFDVNLLSRDSLQKEANLDCSVSAPDMQRVHVGGNEQSMPVFDRSFVDEKEDFGDFLHQPHKSTGLSTPFSQLSDLYKIQDTPDVSHSVPNGLSEYIEVRSNHSLYEHVDRQLKSSNFLLNDSIGSALGGKSYSDCLLFPSTRFDWDFCKPYLSPIGKGFDGTTSGGSDKHGNSNPELTCFPIEEDQEISDEVLNSYEVAEISGEDGSGVGKKIREPLRDATTSVKRESLKYVSTEISINETPKRANHNTGKQESRCRHKKPGKENCSSSLGVISVNKRSASLKTASSKPELLGKRSLNRRDQSSLEECKRNNIVSDVKSFLPLVQKNQAAAVSGKRDVKVRALGAAEAAKRLAEKKENERKQKKEALKLERARIQQENLRQLELKRKLKEEEQKKKEADAVARKRQKEEKEKKEKQRKRMCLEDARRQQGEGPKVQADKELLRHGTAEDSSGERENYFMKPAIGLGTRGVVRRYDGLKTMCDKMGPSPGSCNLGKVVDIDAAGTSTPIHNEKVNSVIQNVREHSYDISPYQCSEDEEEEDDDVPNGKFVPAWASNSCVALAISSEKRDPDLIFPPGSFCSLDKIFMPRRIQKL